MSRSAKKRLPWLVVTASPAPPTGLPDAPTGRLPPLTCWLPTVATSASKVALLIAMPAPAVLPCTELPERPVIVVLATAPPATTIAEAPVERTFVLPDRLRLSAPETRLTSIALPVCVPAAFQLLFVITTVTVPVVRAFRLT